MKRAAMTRCLLALALLLCTIVSLTTADAAQSLAGPFVTGYRWDAMRRLVGVIEPDPDGVTTTLHFPAQRFTYDIDGRLVRIEKGVLAAWQDETVAPSAWTGFTQIETTSVAYDPVGNVVEQRRTVAPGDATALSVTQMSADRDGRPYCVAERMNLASVPPLPAGYDREFACTPGSAGNFGPDRITKTISDPAGQVVEIRKAVGTSLEQSYVRYAYTPNGKQAFVTDANGNKARLCYDGVDRQFRWIFPSKTVTGQTSGVDDNDTICAVSATSDYEEYGYDKDGNRTSLRKRDAQSIVYTYDALDRVATKNPPGTAGDVSYTYDALGRQLGATFTANGEGVTSGYDPAGRQTSSTLAMGGVSRQLSYQYDANGNRTRLTWPDGPYATYDYDGLDRAQTIKENGSAVLASLVYDDAGR